MYNFFAYRFLRRVRACEPGQLRRHRRQSAISVSWWTLTHLQGFISFCLRPIVESGKLWHHSNHIFCLSSQSAWHLIRLSALEDGAGIDYNYNNYEHAAAASDHNTDVVSYGTWTKRQTRLNKTAAKFCHFYHTFQKAFKSTKTVLTYPLLILETHDWTIYQPCRSCSIFWLYSVLLFFLS